MRKLIFIISIFLALTGFSQPLNDSCARPQLIPISKGGFGTGVFTTDTFNINKATSEGAEYFHPDLVSVGNDKKSIWFKFFLPVKRAVRIELKQPSTKINSKDVGFVTYKTNTCYPGYTQATDAYITPLNQFGSSFHPCMEAGWYMIQVGSKAAANGPVFIELSISYPVQYSSVTSSYYDLTDSAYSFGTLKTGRNQKFIEFETGCHTLQDSSEYYPCIGSNYKDFSQTSWHTFRTDRRIDYLELLMSEAIASPMVYFPAGTKIYANLYEGDVKTSNYKTLKKIDSCIVFDFDQRLSTRGFAGKSYMCLLKNNTVYSIQLIFKTDFYRSVRLTLRQRSSDSATLSPQPVRSKMAPNSKLGVLKSSSAGTTTVLKDYLSCESRLINSACGKANPASGVNVGGVNYGLATWCTFSLKSAANIKFEFLNSNNNQCAGRLAFRLFRDTIPVNCNTFDTSHPYNQGILDGNFMYCVLPGNYTMQILGIDTADYLCNGGEHLGYNIDIGINVVHSVQFSRFGLSDSASIDSINKFKPLLTGQTYNSQLDEFGCEHSVLPGANRCDTAHKKAIYRLLKIGDSDNDNVADSGMLAVFNVKTNIGPEKIQYALYNKNLRQLAIKQNKYLYPDTLSNPGLYAQCTNYNVSFNGASSRYYCLVPGDYTFGAFGGVDHLGVKDQPNFIFTKTKNLFHKPSAPENMDTIRTTKDSKIDFFSCLNNAVAIDGSIPCGNKKVIYREFYLDAPQLVRITNFNPTSFAFIGTMSLYKGRVSQGVSGLRLLKDPDGRKWECFTDMRSNDCYPLTPGWYTIVSSASGPGYDDKVPFDDVSSQNSGNVNGKNRITINIIKQVASKFNRPFKAWPVNDSLNNGKPLSWKPNYGNLANPKNGYIFTLRTENFTCVPDTPFSLHPLVPCDPNYNHVAYYVFSLKEESYLRVMGLNPNIKVFIFNFDVRTDSSKMKTNTPVQSCNTYSRIEMCRIQPGTYTMVLMCSNGASFPLKVTPALYIDSVGTSKYDFANNAYDFGRVTGDSVWYGGKIGTKHPINGRAASSDFFFCTTGAAPSDPMFACGGFYNPNIYPDKKNNAQYNVDSVGNKYTYLGYHAVRNLWYTFTLKGAGRATIKIDNVTNGNVFGNNLSYGVYLTDEKGNIPFDTLRKYGKVDSTMAMGLSQIEYQPNSGQCNGTAFLSVSKDICDSISERRYYVVISLNEAVLPNLNSQVAVSILFDSVPIPAKRFDHYSQANVINGLKQSAPSYTNVNLTSGQLYQGFNGFFANTSTDTADQTTTCSVFGKKSGTIWYKFKVDSTGTLLLNLRRFTFSSGYTKFFDYTPANNAFDDNIVLLKEIVAGDSTTNGLQRVMFDYNPINMPSLNRDFATSCINKGWYYIQLSSCGLECSDYLVPEIILQYQKGDFCSTPVQLKLNTLGSTSGAAIVNCHSIGEGFGEDGSNMGCLYGPGGYKSTWFRLDYNDSAKADIEFKLTENTNAQPSDIRFRTFYGGCAALTPGPCNTNSQTVFSLTCMKKGSYYVQVVSPESTLGKIDLQVTAKKNLDTSCKPYDTWTPNANFTFNRTCPLNKLKFVNYSTTGDSIKYKWTFGFGKPDTTFAPIVNFPIRNVDVTYKVKLIVYNPSRAASDSILQDITIPATPVVNLGKDTSICIGDTVTYTYTHAKYRHYWNFTNPATSIKVSTSRWVSLTVVQKFGNDSCFFTDSAFVKVNKLPTFSLGNDTALCKGDSLLVKGPVKMKSYTWSNGKSTPTIKISNQTVQLTVTDTNRCVFKDIIQTTWRVYTDTIIKPAKAVCVDVQAVNIKVKPSFAGNFYGNNAISANGVFSPGKAGAGNHKVNYQFKDAFGCTFKDSILIRVNPLPNASITKAGPYCIDAGLQKLTPSVNKGGKFFGGAYVDSIGNFNPKIAGVGKHKVFYFYRDNNSCGNTDSIVITVNPLPDASITVAGPFCLDAGVQRLLPKTNKGGKFYGGSFIDSIGNFNPAKSKVGTHKVYYIYTDVNKCKSFDSTTVKVNDLPNATITSAGPYCIDAGHQIMGAKISAGGWFTGGKYVDSSGTFDPFTAGVGNHKVYYTIIDNNGCVGKDSTFIKVNPLPDASIVSSGPYCVNYAVKVLSPKTNKGGKFFGGMYIDSAGNFDPVTSGAGDFKVYYRVTDANGCSNLDSTSIKVNALSDPSITPAGPYCIDAGIKDILPKINKGGRFIGGNYIDSTGKFNPATAGQGSWFVKYIFTDANKCTSTDSIYVKVNPLPDASINLAGPYCIDVGVKAMTAKNNPGGKFYGGNYIDSAGRFNPKISGAGLHTVKYTFTDNNKCIGFDSIKVLINPLPDPSIIPAGPFCIDNGVVKILPKSNPGGKFYGGSYIDSAGNFDPFKAKAAVHKVAYIVKDANACINKDSIFVKVNPLPIATINPSGPFCVDAGLQLVKPKVNAGGKFFGGKYIDSIGVFQAKIAGVGVHKVYYFFKDKNGCKNTDSILVKVNALPNASINAAGPYCIDAPVDKLTPKVNLGGKFSGGVYIDSTGKFNPSKAGIGLAKVIYTFTDNNKCTNIDSIRIRVNTLPDASIQLAGPFCLSVGNVSIKPKSNPGGTFGGGAYIDNLGVFNSYIAGPGTHKVVYKITDSWGCKNADSINVVVNPLPDARVIRTGPFCDNEGLKQVYPVSPAITGVFYGGPYISKTGVFDPAIAKAGLHTIIYKAIDVNLCENVDSIQLRVNGHPIADFTGVPLSGCVPLTVDFTATPGYTKYDWDFGNGKTGQGDILQSKYPNAGSYPISLKVTDINNCVSIVTKPNYITAHPRPQASFNYSPKQINLSLTTVQFTNFTVGSNISKYTWTVDNQFETNQQDFSKIFHDSGNIKISMIAENQWGCIDSTTQYIFVIDTFIIFIPNAFSPNNDGVNDIFKVGGIGIRYLEMNIYNRWGERLFTQKDDSNSFGWDGIYLDETVPQGAYMYTILARDNINRPYLFKGMVTVLK